MIISLSGRSQAGKDSIGDVLVSEFGYRKLSFARNLKEMVQLTFNLSKWHTDTQEGKATEFDTPIMFTKQHLDSICEHMNMTHELLHDSVQRIAQIYTNKLIFKTPREILQLVGTEICRGIIPSYHLDIIEKKIQASPFTKYVVVDSRYANEREMLQKYDAKLILVNRPSINSSDTHISEQSLGNSEEYDFIIENTGTLEDLRKQVRYLMTPIILIK